MLIFIRMKRILVAFLLTASTAVASPIAGHPEPLPEERLDPAINLFGRCFGVNIVEWRGSEPTDQALRLINLTCNTVVDNFYPFVQRAGFSAPKHILPSYSLSLLPLNYRYRSLNDNSYRFRDRPKFCSATAEVCRNGETPLPLVGWTDWDHQITFVRNDPIVYGQVNSKFQALLAHELFHVLSFESGVFNKHGSIIIEENLARKFTRYLGYGDII